jgi:Flp pilus assembly protein TadD
MKALKRTFVYPVFLILIIWSMWLPSAQAEEIPLSKEGGVYTIPVEINGVLTLQFILDSGAAEVLIPADVALTLIRAGTIQRSDFLPGRSYTLADGSTVQSPRFVLRRLKIGTRLLTQVPASIGDLSSMLLLGQSVLERFGTWSMDNQRRMLVLGPVPTLNERFANKETMPTLEEVQQRLARLRQRQVEQERVEQAAQQRTATGSGAQQGTISAGETYVRQMITYAMANGGIGNEADLLATKRRIEALQPKRLTDATARKRARAENERGLQFINAGQIAEAAQAFQAAYEADPTDVEIINNLGDAYQRLYNLQAAEPLLLKALVFTPGRANAWANLGHTYAKQGQYNAAVACYANAYRFSRNQDVTRQLFQKWAVEEDEWVRTAVQQTLQLSLVQ